MALLDSSIAQACRAVADCVAGAFPANEVRVSMGSPAAAVPGASDTDHRINLFFHRFEPSGIGAPVPGEPFWLRIHCIVTAFAAEEDIGDRKISAGENDLRMLGAVLRFFHEEPVLTVMTDDVPVGLQMVLAPLSLDDINRLWSTQKDTVYRPSLAYEVSLVPVQPSTPMLKPPRVSALGVGVGPRGAPLQGRFASPPPLAPPPVDTSRPDWAPQIGFVADGTCVSSLEFAQNDPLLGEPLRVAAAGAVGTTVELRWEIWDAQQGWRAAGVPSQAIIALKQLNPGAVPDSACVPVSVPLQGTGQAILCAVRKWVRPDGVEVSLRSNLLLVTVHEGDTA